MLRSLEVAPRVLVLLLSSSALMAQEADLAVGPGRAAVRGRIDAAVGEQELVGLAVGVVLEGRVAYLELRGWEDREAGVPVTDQTRFRWASISKPVTAVTALQLVRSGALDLDGDVRELVPELPDRGHPITARQLLGHLGGIVHYSNGPVVRTPRTYPVEHPFEDVVLALDTFKDSPLVAEPGTRYAYSTHGYILLSAAVQRAGGAPFWSQVRERVVEPLGLATLRPDYQWEEIPHRAVGYRRSKERIVRSSNTDVSWKLGGGGFLSTVGDLAGFAAGLLGGDLLGEEEKRLAWTPLEASGESSGYGLGFRSGTAGGVRIVEHSGSQEKTRTWMRLVPEHDLAVVVMTNSEWAKLRPLVGELIAALLEPR